ncbi:hypothetical protein [Vulcanisaeta sp. JCM 14467]
MPGNHYTDNFMDLSELMNLLISRGVDYVMAQLPSWISRREVSREDASIILMYIMSNKLDELGKKIDDLSKKVDTGFNDLSRKIDDLRKEVIDRLDLISNQLRVLNSNIAATYELTSKVMTKIMETSFVQPPRS